MPELPVFPLPSTVVFPGMTLPLYVFEARYRRLVRYCQENDVNKFIITLAQSGSLKEDALGFHDIGTIVNILEITENADGTFGLLGHGQDKCKLTVTKQEEIADTDGTVRPLHFSEEEPLCLERDDLNMERLAAWDTLDVFRRYAKTFFAFDALKQIEEVLPEDMVYQASFICANLRIPAEERQMLLEVDSLAGRFKLSQSLMEAQIEAFKPQQLSANS